MLAVKCGTVASSGSAGIVFSRAGRRADRTAGLRSILQNRSVRKRPIAVFREPVEEARKLPLVHNYVLVPDKLTVPKHTKTLMSRQGTHVPAFAHPELFLVAMVEL